MSHCEYACWALRFFCIFCAALVMMSGKDGWGWLLLVAVLL